MGCASLEDSRGGGLEQPGPLSPTPAFARQHHIIEM